MGFFEFLKQNKAKSDGEKPLTDKIFLRSVAISFFAIIICIVMLSASTFAWFNSTVESKEETIAASVYLLEFTAKNNQSDNTILSTTDQNGNKVFLLSGGIEYTVTATAIEENTTGNTGYFKLRVGDTTYISDQIDRGHKLEFTLTFTHDAVENISLVGRDA